MERIETAVTGLFNELADLKKEREAREASRPKPIGWLRQRAVVVNTPLAKPGGVRMPPGDCHKHAGNRSKPDLVQAVSSLTGENAGQTAPAAGVATP